MLEVPVSRDVSFRGSLNLTEKESVFALGEIAKLLSQIIKS